MVIVDEQTQLPLLEAIFEMAMGLERWFPNNNGAFAYGTRLCEETGELVDALQSAHELQFDPTSRSHLIKEIEDVLQIVMGLAQLYELKSQLSLELETLVQPIGADRLDEIVVISRCAGYVADAINHAERQGIKSDKHDSPPAERLSRQLRSLAGSLAALVMRYELLADLEIQAAKDYRTLAERGYIG